MQYPALFEPAEEGGFVVTFPDFDWGVTQGDTDQEAREMAVDALSIMIEEHIRRGERIPRPSRPRGKKIRMIELPVVHSAKAELYRVFRASGIRKTELANRLGMPEANIDRLFDLRYHSRLEHIEAAFRALGKQIAIEIRDAA